MQTRECYGVEIADEKRGRGEKRAGPSSRFDGYSDLP